jgi:hypothetical protein
MVGGGEFRLIAGQMSADYSRAVPTINLTDDELAATVAAIRRAIEEDRFPRAPRLDPLRAALAKFEAEAAARPDLEPVPPVGRGSTKQDAPSGNGDKRTRSAEPAAPKISPGFKLGRLPPDR